MKILMFGWEFPPYISGGLGTACFGLTRHLAPKGAKIKFVIPKIKGPIKHDFIQMIDGESVAMTQKELYEDESVTSHIEKFIKIDSFLTPYLNEKSYKELLLNLFEKQKTSGELNTNSQKIFFSGDYGPNLMAEVSRYSVVGRAIATQEHFDIIHAHDWLTFLAGVEAKKVSGKPLVIHVHATEFDRCGDNINQEIYNIERHGMQNADRIIAVSHRTKEMIVSRYNIPHEKVVVVHNAVEKSETTNLQGEIRPFGDDKIVTFLGRITMQKGPDYFLEAARKVIDKIPNVRFVMAGAGDMTKRLIERMAHLRIAENFHFTGFLNEKERERLFAMSDLYIMPSVSEPFGITPLEVMRYNIPIIISKQSGVAEILGPVIKVDFWDTEKLSSNIINILNNPPLKEGLVKNYKDALDKIDWSISADKVMAVYTDVLRR